MDSFGSRLPNPQVGVQSSWGLPSNELGSQHEGPSRVLLSGSPLQGLMMFYWRGLLALGDFFGRPQKVLSETSNPCTLLTHTPLCTSFHKRCMSAAFAGRATHYAAKCKAKDGHASVVALCPT